MAKFDAGKGRVIKSVADVHYFDDNDNLIAFGTALSSSAITTEVQETAVQGGYLNPEILDFKYGRTLTLTATSVTFIPEYLELNLGTKFKDVASEKYVYAEAHTVDATGNIELKHMPTAGNILITQGETIISNDFNTGTKTIVVGLKYAGTQVAAAYFYGKNVVGEETNTIEFNTATEPMTVKAIVTFHYQETSTSAEGLYQIVIPRLKLSGSITLDLSADGTSTMELGGKGLTYIKDDGQTILATWTVIPQVSAVEQLEELVIQPSEISFENAGETRKVNVIAVYNTGRKELLPIANVTLESSDTAVCTVDAAGIVTSVGTGVAVLTAEYQTVDGATIVEME